MFLLLLQDDGLLHCTFYAHHLLKHGILHVMCLYSELVCISTFQLFNLYSDCMVGGMVLILL